MTKLDAQLQALEASVTRLKGLVEPLTDEDLARQSYDDEWSIADVLSHLGSGAVIMRRGIEDALVGDHAPDDFNPSVWATWNAKSDRSKADDALVADRALIDRLGSLSDEERSAFRVTLGPFDLDLSGFVGLRLNEHALHTWDVEVTLDPAATVAADAVDLVVDNLEFVARFRAKPTGSTRTFVVATTDPARSFSFTLSPDAVSFEPAAAASAHDTTMPAESFARLLYGRLDADHTPPIDDPSGVVDELRRAFPGS